MSLTKWVEKNVEADSNIRFKLFDFAEQIEKRLEKQKKELQEASVEFSHNLESRLEEIEVLQNQIVGLKDRIKTLEANVFIELPKPKFKIGDGVPKFKVGDSVTEGD